MSDRIDTAIARKGWTQKVLCGRLGWKDNRISRVKRGEIHLRASEVVDLARKLGVSPGWLIDDSLPDDPDVSALPVDEEIVLRAYRKARGILAADEVVYLIAEARGQRLGAPPDVLEVTVTPDNPILPPSRKTGTARH